MKMTKADRFMLNALPIIGRLMFLFTMGFLIWYVLSIP